MDWQDELRQLDKQLSEGEISAQEYRRMRDELLAEASAPAQGRGSLWSSARPDSPPPPFPAAPAPDADDTQIVADTTVTVDEAIVHAEDQTEIVDAETAAGTPPEEQTQVVAEPVTQVVTERPVEPAIEPAHPMDAPTVADPVPVAEPVSGPTILRPAPMEPKDHKVPTFPPRPSDTPPPPAPPLPPPAPWTGHQVIGEEVFADAKPHSAARRAATAAFSLLVVLAVVGAAVWFFVFRSDGAPAAEPKNPPATEKSQAPPPSKQPSSAPPPSSAPVPVPDGNLGNVVGPLPGAADKHNGTITAARAGQLKLIAPAEVKAAQGSNVTDVIFRGSTSGSVGMALLVFTTPNGESAAKLMGTERAYLLEHGFSNGKDLASGLPVLEQKANGATVYRVVYSTGKYTVRFGVAQRDANPQDLRRSLESVADSILAVLPPS